MIIADSLKGDGRRGRARAERALQEGIVHRPRRREPGRPVDEGEAPPQNERVIRHQAEPYAFALDGRPVAGVRAATSLPREYNPLYRETEALDLAPGPHELRLVRGEGDSNFFLPAAFAAGAFAVADQTLKPLPKRLGYGSLAACGLGTYAGKVTYRLAGVRPAGAHLRLGTGGVFARAAWNGRDLGVCGWEPFAWKLPSSDPGCLDVTLHLPAVNILGDYKRPGAAWDVHFWCPPRDVECAPGLYRP